MKLRLLPMNPSRYLSFEKTALDKQLWYIIENGLCSFGLALILWADTPPSTVYDEIEERFVPLVLGA